jgi:hypothetical protein
MIEDRRQRQAGHAQSRALQKLAARLNRLHIRTSVVFTGLKHSESSFE